MELSDLIDRYGFYKLVTMELDESGRISRNFARPNEYTNVLYAIVVNSSIQYIGKSILFVEAVRYLSELRKLEQRVSIEREQN